MDLPLECILLHRGAQVSIVAHGSRPGMLLVRARRPGDIERILPGASVEVTPRADYRYRAVAPAAKVADAIATRIQTIDYTNFKASVVDDDLAPSPSATSTSPPARGSARRGHALLARSASLRAAMRYPRKSLQEPRAATSSVRSWAATRSSTPFTYLWPSVPPKVFASSTASLITTR